jgi:hypothetical protein
MVTFPIPEDFPERIAAMERMSDHFQRIAETATGIQEAYGEFAAACRTLSTSVDVETLQKAGAAAAKATQGLTLFAALSSDEEAKRDGVLSSQWLKPPTG